MDKIRILHISDLHYGKDKNKQDDNIDKFLDDIEKEKIDIVIFSGDLVNVGKEENFEEAKKFLQKLLNKLSLGYDSFFISPGNHDINRLKINKYEKIIKKDLKTLKDISEVITAKEDLTFFNKLNDFNNFKKEITVNKVSENNLYSTHIVEKKGKKIGIACLNSTIFCGCNDQDDKDQGNLILGEDQIIETSGDLKETDIKICVFHHGLEYFREIEKQAIQTTLYEKYDLLLTGHFHYSTLEISKISDRGIIKNMSGALYESSRSYHGYTIIEIDESNYKFRYRTYYPERRKYDIGTNVIENGELIVKKKVANNNIKKVNQKIYNKCLEIVNKKLISNFESCNAPKNIFEIFVEPNLSTKIKKNIIPSKKDDIEKISDLINENQNLIIIGRKESGKTTIINYMILKILKENIYDEKIPIYLEGKKIKKEKKIEKLIHRQLINLEYYEMNPNEIKKELEMGKFIIFIDDLELESKIEIEEIIKKYPSNRYIFTMTEEYGKLEPTKNEEINIDNFKKKMIYIYPFDRKKTKELTLKWCKIKEVENIRVEGLLKNIRRMGIPLTPNIISLLLWINDKQIRYNPVNKASILQVFFDIVLEKMNFERMFEKIDFDEKMNYLSYIACEMRSENKKNYDIVTFEQKSNQHLKDLKITNIEVSNFIDYFIKKGILIKIEDKIGFKYESFYEYFIAKKMSENDEYRDEILKEENYYLMPEEIEYYSGIRRENTTALIKINEYLSKLMGNIEKEINNYNFKFNLLVAQDEEFLEEKNIDKNINSFLESPFEEKVRLGYKEKKVQIRENNTSQKYYITLKLLSNIFRNCTLTKDKELREKIYTNLLKNYASLLITFDENLEKINIEEKDFFKFLISILLTEFMSDSLVSERLEEFIEESKESKIKIIKFLSNIMLLDGQFENSLDDVSKYVNEEKNILFLEIIRFKLYKYLIYRNCLNIEEKEKVKNILRKIMRKTTKGFNKNNVFIKQRIENKIEKEISEKFEIIEKEKKDY